MKPTIEDVASAAEVSRQTVSRVLNNKNNVSPKTRSKVIKAMKKLDYHPNEAARNFSRKHPKIIGFYTPFTEEKTAQIPFYSQVYPGITRVCMENDYQFYIFTNNKDQKTEDSIIQAFNKKKLGGLLITCPSLSVESLVKLKEKGLAFVIMGRPALEKKFIYIDHNNKKMGYKGTRHLIKSGCKRIILINGPKFMTYSEDYNLGYKDALEEHQISYNSDLVFFEDLTQADGFKIMKKILKMNLDFDGIYVVNGMMTLGVFEAVRQEGLSIPEDFSLFCGSINGIKEMYPQITGFTQDYNKFARTATELLIKVMDEETIENKSIVLESEFFQGTTC